MGRYPTISLKEAREKAKQLLAEITLGINQSRTISYRDARALFLEACAAKNKKNTVDYYRKRLDTHFRFGRKRLNDISREDVQSRIRKIKTSTSEQNHAFVVIRTFLNWALREQYIDTSPIAALKPPARPKARGHVLTDLEICEVLEKSRHHPYPFGPIVSLLVLTGQRRSEIASLQWDWINLESQTFTFPSSLTKNKTKHVMPFGRLVGGILQNIPTTSQFLFPARSEMGTVFNGWGKSKGRFDNELVDVEPYTLHDLRRSFATIHAKIGTPIHVTEKLLNHISGTISGVAAIYNRHTYLEEMRTAMDHFDEYLWAWPTRDIQNRNGSYIHCNRKLPD